MIRILLLALSIVSCTRIERDATPSALPTVPDVRQYWNGGTAEISRFTLTQARYGSTYRGDAVMIFVKEDFLPEKQVKYEGHSSGESPVPILKLISTRDFLTGMYPYSLMTSVFSPLDQDAGGTLKVTSTTQDWCGQTFMQINRRDSMFAVAYRSYFEGEGDRDFTLSAAILEDELFTLVRQGVERLPVGAVSVLPSLHCVQLRIKDFKEHSGIAQLALEPVEGRERDSAWVYTIRYRDIPRTFSMTIERSRPHRILAWEETEGGLTGGTPLTTRAVRTHTIMSDYWRRSAPGDTVLRRALGL